MIYRLPPDSDWSFAPKQGNKEAHLFLNFLNLSVFLDLFICVCLNVCTSPAQWQLVIHFSSATRSVPCVLIRENSLVGLTQVSLKH